MSAGVQQTSSAMQQVASAAQQLASASQELEQVVSRFQLDEHAAQASIIELSINDHETWTADIIEMVAGKKSLKPKGDHHECRLGKWYDTLGKKDFGTNATFVGLEKDHAEIHELGNRIINAYNEGNKDAAKKDLAGLKDASRRVVSGLKALER
jgi:methyl-accepting chemotaxis protein